VHVLALLVALALAGAPRIPAPPQDAGASPPSTADPLAPFARMVRGEWRMTAASGSGQFDRWTWGPGRHSIRNRTFGFGAGDTPWASLDVYYRHPGRGEVRVLHLHPDIPGVGRGAGEGTMSFEGERAEATYELFQPGAPVQPRALTMRWTFDGPDRFREELLETTGPAGPSPLAEWLYVRHDELTPPPAHSAPEASPPARHLAAFAPLLGTTRAVRGTWTGSPERSLDVRATFEWLPLVEVVLARVVAPAGTDEPIPLLDAYLYHHPTADELRCLALSADGGVHAGTATVLEDGAVQLELESHAHGDAAAFRLVHLELRPDGVLRGRVQSAAGLREELLLDARAMSASASDGSAPPPGKGERE
jgi:hypothetical protein